MKHRNAVRKFAAVALSAVMGLSLAACGGQSSSTTAATSASQGSDDSQTTQEQSTDAPATGYVKDTLKVGTSKDAGTFDAFITNNWGSVDISYYQYLAETDCYGNLYNVILKSCEKVDDLTYSLEIWDCVHDSEGTPITIDDVIWCYNYQIESGNGGGIKKIDSFEKTGDYTCNMILNEAFVAGDLEKYLSNVKIVSQATYEEMGDMTAKPVGTGPYVLSEYVAGTSATFEANEDWWFLQVADQLSDDEIAPSCRQNFKTIEFDFIQEAASRAVALEMGTVDVVDSLDDADIQAYKDNSDFTLIDIPKTPPVMFLMNASDDSPFKSQELRQAVCYALDNTAITAGMNVEATECYGFQPNAVDAPESWTTGEGRDWYAYDLDKAKELLEESGYNGETVTLMYQSSTAFDSAALMIQAALDEIGIPVELKCVENSIYETDEYYSDAWDIRIVEMGGGTYLQQLTKNYWSGDDTEHIPDLNVSLVADEKLDELYLAMREDDSEENIAAWDEYFTEKAYGYSICTYVTQTACTSELQNNFVSDRGRLIVSAMTLAE